MTRMSPLHRIRWLALAPFALMLLAGPARSAELTVDIEAVGTQSGRLSVFLYDSEDAWNGKRDAVRRQRIHPNGSNRLQVRFDGLRAGRYGVMVLHDTDGNGKFDVGPLGIPRDDYGFSNNPRVFKRPGFAQIAFDLPGSGRRISVRMR